MNNNVFTLVLALLVLSASCAPAAHPVVIPTRTIALRATATQLPTEVTAGSIVETPVSTVTAAQQQDVEPVSDLILYTTRRSGLNQLWTVDAGSGRLDAITHSQTWNVAYPAWSPDGKWITFTALQGPETSLHVVDWRGEQDRVLVAAGAAGENGPAAWSPDGTNLAYIAPDKDSMALFTLTFESGATQVRLIDDLLTRGLVSWAPDGLAVALTLGSPQDNPQPWEPVAGAPYRIGRVDLIHESSTFLTSGLVSDSEPMWSPDGSRIAFACYDEKLSTQICVINADGSGRMQITHQPGPNALPDWSPDGTRLVFESFRDSPGDPNSCFDLGCNLEIYVINVDGTGEVRLTDHPSGDWGPAWSPDGSRIAFASQRDETRLGSVCGVDCNSEIYVMDTDGSNLRRLTETDTPDWAPLWRPVGQSTGSGQP